MNDELKSRENPLADLKIFWPTFLVFVVLLVVTYMLTAP